MVRLRGRRLEKIHIRIKKLVKDSRYKVKTNKKELNKRTKVDKTSKSKDV